MAAHSLKELFTPYFDNLTDPRVNRTKRHALLDLIVLALAATLGGANGWADIERFGKAKRAFFQEFLELPHGIPSHDTFGRVFARLDPAVLLEAIRNWFAAFRTAVDRELVAIDGKTLRGSYDTASGQSPLHLVSAWASEARLVLGQVQVSDKSNEITAIPVLLKLLDLEGCIVTIDAIGCQTEIVEAIRGQGADYVLTLKANQGTLYEDAVAYWADCLEQDFAGVPYRYLKTVEEDHGRKEIREYYVVDVPADWQQHARWRDLRSLGLVWSERQGVSDESEVEMRFFISSLPAKVKQFARSVRGHWGIENQLHWSLDVTFAEDQSRVRRDHGPMNLGMFRRLALSILQQDTSGRDSLRGKRLSAGWDEDRLRKLLTGFCGK
jgi:predicted transposase YbfD/YdcC